MYFEIHKSPRSKQYWFVIKSLGNHKALASSEMYERKASAVKAIEVIASSKNAQCFDKTGE